MAEAPFDSQPFGPGARLAAAILERLAIETADPPGVTRTAYGEGERLAHAMLRAEGLALGAEPSTDAAGNLYLRFAGRDRSLAALFIGSHLDSVPHGGNFDGAAGVVAGLGAMVELRQRGIVPPRDVVLMVTRAEEAAWFPLSYPGARAALGQLDPAELDARRSDSGGTLADHMAEEGFDPEAVRRGERAIEPSAIAAFVEVHIEQGPRLVAAGAPVGIVTGIAGGFRHVTARCFGAYGHSGAEPRCSRSDAVLGFADLVTALELEWNELERDGKEATITFGRVESDPAQHGGSRILGEIGFTLDVRSADAAVLARIATRLERCFAEIGDRRRVSFKPGPRFTWDPATMSTALVSSLASAAQTLGMKVPHVPSGAGHDAAAFAGAGVPSAMIFVRNRNGSHNPDEAMEIADLEQAILLLARFAERFNQPEIIP